MSGRPVPESWGTPKDTAFALWERYDRDVDGARWTAKVQAALEDGPRRDYWHEVITYLDVFAQTFNSRS